jgi:hypothetical protein
MGRLIHSYSGQLRSMQMSTTQVFAFVEGKQLDTYFFANLCNTAWGNRITYEISTAIQLPGGTGGKNALLAFFSFLRKRKSLFSNLGGKRTVCVFFLDKDVDDLRGIKKRSLHLVYTQHYDVQNYVFEHGDLTKASAAAGSIDPRKLEIHLGDAHQWCLHIAILWREWVGLCLRMIKDSIPCEANYKNISRVQTRLCGPTDQNDLQSLTYEISQRINIPIAEFKRRLDASTKKVDHYYAKSEHHRIFKGKWFAAILADDIDRLMAGDPYNGNKLNSRLMDAVAVTLDFSLPWADYFRKALHDIGKLV